MNAAKLPILDSQHVKAAEIATRYPLLLSAAGFRLLAPDMTPAGYFRALRAAGCDVDARKFLAHALPKRRALWWGCLCAWDGLRGKASAQDSAQERAQEIAALECVLAFIRRPGDENRRLAQSVRAGGRPSSPAFTLAAAAFVSTGSIAPPGAETVPAPDHLTGRLVSVAVYLAAALREPAQYKLHLRHYLTLGEAIARGELLWQEELAADCVRFDAGAERRLAGPHFLQHCTTDERHRPTDLLALRQRSS
jgi:hypothetical protein